MPQGVTSSHPKHGLTPLLAAGADPGETDEEGRTTWELAARTGLIEAMRRAWRETRGTEPPA